MSYQSIAQGGSVREEADRALFYEARLNLFGLTATIFPFGDSKHLVAATTFKTVGAEQVTCTYSKDPLTWDSPPSLQGLVPVLTFDGVDEEIDTPDITYFSRVNSTPGDDPMSLEVWVNMVDATESTLISKWDHDQDRREWVLQLNGSDKIQFTVADEGEVGNPTLDTEADVAIGEGLWVCLGCSWTGSLTASPIILYVNGIAVAQTSTDDAGFLAGPENTIALVRLGNIGAVTKISFFDGLMAGGFLGPLYSQAVATPDQFLRSYELGRRALEL
ncbi:hypothetical protein LCGC14_2831410 [marine sediment metagenome]|uniref:LamG-like jellyroll fold domain-containing protein n=1 Tax=marine sediment metagenome TaxID=412755 RepID=A0A0F9B4W7_9ZZZZ